MEAFLTPDNARLRVLKHLRNQASSLSQTRELAVAGAAVGGSGDDIPDPNKPKELSPGMMKLYSYYAPSLQGGKHNIVVTQTVIHPDFKPDPPSENSPSSGGSNALKTSKPILNEHEAVLISTQEFNVNAPRFALPPGIIHQTYPPQGLGDSNNVLPHIVFEDPHLPWENEASSIDTREESATANNPTTVPTTGPGDPPKTEIHSLPPPNRAATAAIKGNPVKPGRNMVPWLALFTFTEDELKLTSAQMMSRSSGGFFPEGPPKIPPKSFPVPPDGRGQDRSTFSVKMTIEEYLDLDRPGDGVGVDENNHPVPVRIPIKKDEEILLDQQVDVIFVPKGLFESFFCSYNDSGTRVLNKEDITPATGETASQDDSIPPRDSGVPQGSGNASKSKGGIPDLHRYKYLAHVRNVNTRHMAGAGIEDDGLFSVIHGHRTGPLDVKEPKPMIVHLVSLEGIEDHIRFGTPLEKKSHVALVSLYSWTYLCLPPQSVNFTDAMKHIGHTVTDGGECWLRAPMELITAMDGAGASNVPPFRHRLANRMKDGFVLLRSLLQTGEETVSFYRGPLTPQYVPPIKAAWWPYQTNFSTDYQILDRLLGIKDISYSAAWQLGRTLGIADQAFSAALIRLRSNCQTTGRRGALKKMVADQAAKSKAGLFTGLAKSMEVLATLGSAAAGEIKVDPTNRFALENPPPPTFILTNSSETKPTEPGDAQKDLLNDQISQHVTFLTSGKDQIPPAVKRATDENPAPDDSDEVFIPFNEINVPVSPDWQIVQSWIMNSLFLKNIPAHYLIPDPSFLPRESIRFFYIDTNWMDAFIDGALSIGNHLSQKDDVVRQSFKRALNNYLKTPYRNDHPELNYFPQVPCFGFLMRSAVVKAFPNLEVHAPWPKVDDPDADNEVKGPSREPTLRLETIEKDVLLCLFDRMPGAPNVPTTPNLYHWDPKVQITISQPPHQQCFRLGVPDGVRGEDSSVEMSFRHMFTTDDTPTSDINHPDQPFDPHSPVAIITWKQGQTPDVNPLEPNATTVEQADHEKAEKNLAKASLPTNIFDWTSRTIIFPAFASACNRVLSNFSGTKYFEDDVPTSAVTGTMLTSFISQMIIHIPSNAPGSTSPSPLPDPLSTARKIRIQDDDTSNPSTWTKVHPKNNTPTKLPPVPAPSPKDTHMSQPEYPPLRTTPSAIINKNTHPPIPTDEQTKNQPLLNRDIGAQFIASAYALRQQAPGPGKIAPIAVYADDHDTRNIPIDLVITLTRPKGAPNSDPHKLQLYTVEVEVPLGGKVTDLAKSYAGPGGKMISNPRFNVHVTMHTENGQDFVRFTLVPRAVTRLVPLRYIPEMNFVVWQVRPNGVPTKNVVGTRGAVEIKITESYRRMDNGNPFDHFGISKTFLKKVMAPPPPLPTG